MNRKMNGERGMSLVEVTIILMVLALLTAVIAPSIDDYIKDARQVKAKEDVEAIGVSLVRMLKDTGAPFPLRSGSVDIADRYKINNRVDLLFGPGNAASIVVADNPVFAPGAASATTSPINWGRAAGAGIESLEAHLVLNTPAYAPPLLTEAALAGSGGPRFGIGWRGAYLSALSADPWGNRYEVNSVMIGVGSDSVDLGWNTDTVVISAGSNSVMNSTFAQAGFAAGVDDIVFVIQGSTR
ncbi:MAG: type II secretion system protein [Vicinamibacterales bacterium]